MKLSRWAAVLLLAAPLTAQIDGKAALAQYKAATKPLLKDFKTASNELKSTLLDAIETFEDDLPGSVDPFATGGDLADALEAWQSGIRTLLLQLSTDNDAAWQQALSDFAGGVPLEGIYPEGLVNGDSGAVDDFRASVVKQLSKLTTTINKRLDKAEKAAEGDGFGLLAHADVPAGLNASAASEDLNVSTFPPLTIDILVSLSELEVADDARLWVGGTGNSSKLPVTLTVALGLSTLDTGVVPVEAQQTWLIELDGTGTGVTEGNVIALASVDDSGAIVAAPVGIR